MVDEEEEAVDEIELGTEDEKLAERIESFNNRECYYK